jgi:hypothetical protein
MGGGLGNQQLQYQQQHQYTPNQQQQHTPLLIPLNPVSASPGKKYN